MNLVEQESPVDAFDDQAMDNFDDVTQDPPKIHIIVEMVVEELGEERKGDRGGEKGEEDVNIEPVKEKGEGKTNKALATMTKLLSLIKERRLWLRMIFLMVW